MTINCVMKLNTNYQNNKKSGSDVKTKTDKPSGIRYHRQRPVAGMKERGEGKRMEAMAQDFQSRSTAYGQAGPGYPSELCSPLG